MKLTGKIDDKGKLLMAERDMLLDWCRQHPDKHIELEIKVRRKQRSTLQNAYYHGVIVQLVCKGLRDMGHDVDEVETHEFLKGKFNSMKIVNEDSVVEEIPQSTSKLTTTEMMDYIAKIQMWAAEFLGINIPDPNQQIELQTT